MAILDTIIGWFTGKKPGKNPTETRSGSCDGNEPGERGITNLEYYKTREIAQAGYQYYPRWGMDFDTWLSAEHVESMPSLYGDKCYPYYTATYEEAKRLYERLSAS